MKNRQGRGASPMSLASSALVTVALLMDLCGCAISGVEAVFPEPRPLGEEVLVYQSPVQSSAVPLAPRQFEAPTGVLTLRQSHALALLQNPELAVVAWEIRAGEARILQAGLLPNPELGITVENVAGSGAFKGVAGAETTLHLSQVLELGGKRRRRVRLATLGRDLAAWDYETKRVEVLTRVTLAFVDVLGARERLSLHEELVRLAEQVRHTVAERVKAGKVSPVEETKAGVALSTRRIALGRAGRDLETARTRLAATWGSAIPSFETVEGHLAPIAALPAMEQLVRRLARNPDLARWVTEMAQRHAAVELEGARKITDPTVGAGFRHVNETDDNALVLEVSLPLPVFDRNQGRSLETRYRLAKAGEERRAAEVRVRTALAATYAALATASTEATTLKSEVLPGAQRAFEAVREGYRQGKFGVLDVLDAQRTLSAARGQYIEALVAYHKAVAEVERLIGEPLPAAKNATVQP